MSIEAHLWDREAFTLSDKDQAWTVKRRSFPPQLDPTKDRTNIEEKKIILTHLSFYSRDENHCNFAQG